ncbi:MAG: tRNA (adenosine(37)-N6)-dimethylallyltransferase MiaA [Alphaproteobacteria bacterium]|nr:tRNA (adenosine(37)-N6)-dimethylallyltransferase MiaA [Alphaproteobacteria bacterium]MCB9985439.1 tRNA (adenosine(37)-N6)-dimethylallyltransferase MiaA [Micavibrio sp.]
MVKSSVHVVAGPTAGGKSARALKLAQDLNGVVINADSMQLYDGLPLLTAQPLAQEKALIPHQLYGCLHPNDQINAVSWRDLALAEIYKALERGQVPIVVGGTGFYLKALMQGLSPIPDVPEEVRVLCDDLMDQIGIDEFYKNLVEIDSDLCGKIDPQNRQRLVRAFEVYHHTGKTMSYWQSLPLVGAPEDLEFSVELIMPERDVLYERCNLRFDQMIGQGVMAEVEAFDDLIERGQVSSHSPLTHALGFVPLQACLRGEMDLESAIVLSKNETRHYAKRQATWFRHQMG